MLNRFRVNVIFLNEQFVLCYLLLFFNTTTWVPQAREVLPIRMTPKSTIILVFLLAHCFTACFLQKICSNQDSYQCLELRKWLSYYCPCCVAEPNVIGWQKDSKNALHHGYKSVKYPYSAVQDAITKQNQPTCCSCFGSSSCCTCLKWCCRQTECCCGSGGCCRSCCNWIAYSFKLLVAALFASFFAATVALYSAIDVIENGEPNLATPQVPGKGTPAPSDPSKIRLVYVNAPSVSPIVLNLKQLSSELLIKFGFYFTIEVIFILLFIFLYYRKQYHVAVQKKMRRIRRKAKAANVQRKEKKRSVVHDRNHWRHRVHEWKKYCRSYFPDQTTETRKAKHKKPPKGTKVHHKPQTKTKLSKKTSVISSVESKKGHLPKKKKVTKAVRAIDLTASSTAFSASSGVPKVHKKK